MRRRGGPTIQDVFDTIPEDKKAEVYYAIGTVVSLGPTLRSLSCSQQKVVEHLLHTATNETGMY